MTVQKAKLRTYINREITLKKQTTMTKADSEKRNRIIEEATKDGSYAEWLKFGKKLLRRYYWGADFENLNYDFVHDLILKVLTGVHVKNWDYDKVNINQIMFMNIFGAISKMNKEMKRRKITMDNFIRGEVMEDANGNKKKGVYLDELRHLTLYEVDNEMNKKEYSKLFEVHLAGDKECLELFYGILNNEYELKDNKEIQRKTGEKIRVIKNTKRRMETAIKNFRKKGYDRMFNSEGKEILQ